FNVQNNELREISKKLRETDDNKATNQIRYPSTTRDTPNPRVDPSLLKKPSFSQFIAMMDNFNRQTGVAEPRVSVQEKKALLVKITVEESNT
ncbi:hypothetical protein ANCDUO_22167, partial [Ancylostoma duodenale]